MPARPAVRLLLVAALLPLVAAASAGSTTRSRHRGRAAPTGRVQLQHVNNGRPVRAAAVAVARLDRTAGAAGPSAHVRHPPRCSPSTPAAAIDWAAYKSLPKASPAASAAVYANNSLATFEYANLVLATVASLQRAGHRVDVLHVAGTPHRSRVALLDAAIDLGLAVDGDRLRVVPVAVVNARLHATSLYDVFVAVGDDRAPPFMGLGTLNVYVCTFPYKPDVDLPTPRLLTLPSYDVVVTPTAYAAAHYLFHTELYLIAAVQDGAIIPQFETLAPPRDSAARSAANAVDVAAAADAAATPHATIAPHSTISHRHRHIVVPGHLARNYETTHRAALLTFARVQARLPPDARLILVGAAANEDYVASLRRLVRAEPRVDIVTDDSFDTQRALFRQARVVWLARPAEDETLETTPPVDPGTEWRLHLHMGATLATAMHVGALPVVLDDDDVHSCVTHGVSGWAVQSLGEMEEATVDAFGLDATAHELMVRAAGRAVANRSFDAFSDGLHAIVDRARAARPLRHAMRSTPQAAVPATAASLNVAACIETRHHYALRWSAAVVMRRLPGWALHIHHGTSNARFVSNLFFDAPHVRTTSLPYERMTATTYARVLQTVDFWRGLHAHMVLLFESGVVLTTDLDVSAWMGQYDTVGDALTHAVSLHNATAAVAAVGRKATIVDKTHVAAVDTTRGVAAVDQTAAAAVDDVLVTAVRNARTTTLINRSTLRTAPACVTCQLTGDTPCPAGAAIAVLATSPTLAAADVQTALSRAVGDDVPARSLRCTPSTLAWARYTPSASLPKTAAVYTPYDIIYGGGESYLLQSVASLQSYGYAVDVLVHPENLAKSVDDVMRTARGLRIRLSRDGLRLVPVLHAGSALQLVAPSSKAGDSAQSLPHVAAAPFLRAPVSPFPYTVFYLLGNEKAPKLRGIGAVNFYMCQFPFDLAAPVVPPRSRTLASYDYVLVNSHYTYAYYARYASALFTALVDADALVPQVELLHPPVQPFGDSVSVNMPSTLTPPPPPPGTPAPTPPPATVKRHIALLGRIFRGRQSKGHDVAIAAFAALRGRVPADVRLRIIGNLVPGHDAYLAILKRKAAGLNVDFVVGQSHEQVLALLQSSRVLWHMTGASSVDDDPASHEHFGMAIVEGMLLGCVPIVLKRGGVVDIVHDGVSGFLADDVDALVDKTAAAYALSSDQLAAMTAAARAKAGSFSPAEFTNKLRVLVDRGLLTRPLKHAIKVGAPWLRPHAPLAVARWRVSNVAVLIEPRQHYALRFTTLNVVTHLPRSSWSLHVFHGVTNGRFTRAVLADIDGVRYTRLPYGVMTIAQYNDFLKSETFWTSLRADNVLLYQTDSLLLNTNIADFVGRYDFVGAPWHLDNERWSVMRDALPGGVGNGGLSLRTTASALAIIRQHGAASNSSEQEDVFFVRHMRGGGFRLAARQHASEFCLEVPCTDLRAVDVPLAVHAAWYYNDEARVAALLDRAVLGRGSV